MCIFEIFVALTITSTLTPCIENTFVTGEELYLEKEDVSDVVNSEYSVKNKFTVRKKRDNEINCPAFCESKSYLPVCYCDDLCHTFNDCCFEASKSQQKNTIPVSENAYVCELPYPANMTHPTRNPFGVNLIKNCSRRYQLSLLDEQCLGRKQDLNMLRFIPVASNNGLTYANVFCALCNDVEEVVLWDLETNINLEKTISYKNVSSLFRTPKGFVQDFALVPPPAAKPRICIRTAPNTTRTTLCSKYQEPVMYVRNVYRNEHCIDKNHFQDCVNTFGAAHCQIRCVEEQNIDWSQYIKDRNPKNNLYRISFKIQMEYDSRKCKANEIFINSKVKCARFGCLNADKLSTEDNCNRFRIYYRNFKLGVQWNYRDYNIKLSQVQRYVTVLLYVLYRNQFVFFSNEFILKSPRNTTCGFKYFNIFTSYRNNLNIEDAEKLRAWVASLQISYIETSKTKNYSQLLERFNPDKLYKTNPDFRKQCTVNRYENKRVMYQQDKDLLINALARYHTPFLFNFACNHVHLSLSISDKTDKRGETHREYEPTEFYCVNGHSRNTISICSSLFSLFLCFIDMTT